MADPSRVIIIFVPGVLGSNIVSDGRIGGRRGSKIWFVDFTKLKNWPMQWRNYSTIGRLLDCHRTSASNDMCEVSQNFYGGVIQTLRNSGYAVIPFGYDWRASNRISGEHLRELIAQVHESEGQPKRKIIVMTHSMGGFVTRWALCADDGNASTRAKNQVAGVMHYMCPIFGTPAGFYRIAKGWGHGAPLGLDTGLFLGKNHRTAYEVHKSWESVFELLPNDEYMSWVSRGDNGWWEMFSDEDDVFRRDALMRRRGSVDGPYQRYRTKPIGGRRVAPSGVYLRYVTRSDLQIGEGNELDVQRVERQAFGTGEG